MASGDARDVRVKITADDDTGRGVTSAAKNFQGLEDQVKKTTGRIGAEGRKAGDALGSGVLAGLRTVATTGAPVLAGVAVAAAPLIGATVAAAVLGGAGAGGIIGGVALASRDARVQEAGKLLKERLFSGLEDSASPVLEPLLDAMGQAYAQAEDFDRIMSRVFRGISDDIAPLADSLLDAAAALGEGFADAVEGSGPVLAAFGDGVERIATAAGEGLSLLADNGVEAAQAVSDIASSIVLATDATFRLVDALSTVYGYARAYAEVTTGNVAGGVAIVAAMELQTTATRDLGEGLQFTAAEAEDAAAAVQALNDEIFRAAGINIAAAEANLRYNEAVKAARDSVDGLSKVSAEEEQNLLRQAAASNTVVQALLDQGASTEAVAAATVTARGEFIGTATAMGITRERAEELANSYLAIPETVRTTAVVDAASAQAEIERLRARLGQIPATVNVAIRVTGTDVSRAAVAAGLAKQNFSASAGFQRAEHAERQFMATERATFAPSGGVRRAGGPEPVSVENTVNVTLDGKPFAELTVEAVTAAQARGAFWQRVGPR